MDRFLIKELSINDLFYDVLLHIFTYLDYRSLLNCSKVCKQFNLASRSELLWKKLYIKHWGDQKGILTSTSNDTSNSATSSTNSNTGDAHNITSPDKNIKHGNCSKNNLKSNLYFKLFSNEYRDKGRYVDIYKDISDGWRAIKDFYKQLYPGIVDSLNDGLSEVDLNEFERQNKVTLPNDVRCVYRFHNGQEVTYEEEDMIGLFGSLHCYDHIRTETFQKLKLHNLLLKQYLIVSDWFGTPILCTLEGHQDMEVGTIVTILKSYERGLIPCVIAPNYYEYFMDFANKVKSRYFPIINKRIYKFYTTPSQYHVTDHVAIQVSTAFLPEKSHERNFVHAYLIRFSMSKEEASDDDSCQLESRHWEIVDGSEKLPPVDGPGVVGEHPIFSPGSKYSYISCTNLKSKHGSMKGYYTVRNLKTSERSNLKIPNFNLQCWPMKNRLTIT